MTVHCGAETRSGGACKRPAGWGTKHAGEGKCKLHGGATPVKHGAYSRYSSIKNPRLRTLIEEFAAEDKDPYDLLPEVQLLRALILDFADRHADYTDALLAWHSSFGPEYEKATSAWVSGFERWRKQWQDWKAGWDAYQEDVETVQRFYAQGWPEPPPVPDFAEIVAGIPSPPPYPADFERKPRQTTDILAVGRFIADVGALVERIHKQKQEGTITFSTLDAVMQQFGRELVSAAQEILRDDETRTALLDSVESRWNGLPVPTGR